MSTDDLRHTIDLLEAKNKPTDIEPIRLSWSESSLSPALGSSGIKTHFNLWQSYCDRYNRGEGDRQFTYAGYLLHNLYFSQFRPPRTNNRPNGPIATLINSKWSSWDDFTEEFEKVALAFTGSGWIYLARDGQIKSIVNHAVRQDIVLLIDWWEHAFLSDYGSDKRRYLKAQWTIIDWNAISTRYMTPYRT